MGMKTTKWLTVALPIEDHQLLETEAHLLSMQKQSRVTFADVVKDALHIKAESIRTKRRLRSEQ